jgi:hypothetical protein
MEVDWEARYLAEIASRERLEEEVARLRQRYRQERKRRKAANTKLVQYGCRSAHYLALQPNCSTLTYRSFSTGAESDASTSDSGDSVGSEKYVPSSATVAPPFDCGPVSSTLASLSDTWHRHADKSPRRKSTTAILGLARSQTLVQQVRRPLVRMKQALPLFEHFFVVSHLPQPPRAHR